MATTTNVKQVKLNKMTKAQYDSATKSATELYTTVDESIDYNDLVNTPSLATVATTGSYNDLTDKPTIPAAQVNSDWNANSGVAQILNKPTLATVATTGSYNDLSDKPTLNTFTSATQRNAINSGITSSLVSQITTNKNNITTINNKIPSAASTSNQLADKAFVNSSIANMAANYITSDAQGDNFATKAALLSGPYYHKGQLYTPTNNDYALVEDDETKNDATTRYIYDGAQWAFQYIVNDTPFTQAQLDAINSTITSTKVDNYDTHIADTTIHVTTTDKNNWNAKADDSSVVHKTGNETINGTKTFNDTLELKNNLSFRSYGTNNSGRLQFRAQPSDNVIRGTMAITDGYSTSGSGYNGFVAQMVARAGSTTSEPFNTMRVSNKGIEYIKEANDGTITGQYIIVDNNGLVPSERLATSGSTGQVLTKTSSGQSWQTIDVLPAQSGQSGKFLTTNGTAASWATVPTLPSQTGNSGKFLTTNGSTASWATVNALPSQTGNSGKYLTTDGSSASWGEISEYTAAEITTLWNSL